MTSYAKEAGDGWKGALETLGVVGFTTLEMMMICSVHEVIFT